MTHLTPDQLQARLDDALEGRNLEEADRHLEGCPACREALAQLVAGDEALRAALTHEPGDAYFETFAARVEDRLRAEGLRGAQSRLGGEDRWFGWLRSPRRLAWVASTAVVVAGAAIVLVTTREQRMPSLEGSQRMVDRLNATEAPAETDAPGAGSATNAPGAPSAAVMEDSRTREDAARKESKTEESALADRAAAPDARAKLRGATGAAAPSALAQTEAESAPPAESREGSRSVAPARLQRTVRDAAGNEVAVRDPRFAAPPAPAPQPAPAARAEGEGVRVRRDRVVTPMEKTAPAPAVMSEKLADQDEARGACGTVTDAAGRALAGVVVVHVASGRATTTGADGSFCLPAGVTSGEIAVMAVGYEPARTTLGAEALAVSLSAVPVIGGGPVAGGDLGLRETASKSAAGTAPSSLDAPGVTDAFRGATTAVQAQVRTAQAASRFAGATGSVAAWEAAAGAWTRVAQAAGAGSATAGAARERIAEARYRAWKAAPTAARAEAARRALAEFVLRAPAGAAREQAVKWMAEVAK